MKLKPTPTTICVSRRSKPKGVTMEQERDLKVMARGIPDRDTLAYVMGQTKPETRSACLERIRPYLRAELRDFQLSELK